VEPFKMGYHSEP